MSAARVRLIAVAVILIVLSAGGVFWLARLATGEPSTPAAVTETSVPTPATALPPSSGSGSSAAATGTPSLGSTRTVRPPATTSTRTTVTASKSRDTSPPRPKGAISLGGVTLDNTNPVTMCAAFKSAEGVLPAQVTVVSTSNPDVEISSERCGGDGNITDFPAHRECLPGVTLTGGGDGCYVGITAKAGRPPDAYKSTVRVTVAGRCTAVTVTPCDAPELRASPPTAADPVDVSWTTSVEGVCFQVSSPDPNPFCV